MGTGTKIKAAKEALKKALGEARYEKVFPGSIRIDGDDVHARIDMGAAGTKSVCVSLSRKTEKWAQG